MAHGIFGTLKLSVPFHLDLRLWVYVQPGCAGRNSESCTYGDESGVSHEVATSSDDTDSTPNKTKFCCFIFGAVSADIRDSFKSDDN